MPKIHISDIDLHYETSGEGPPLLFIHGLGSSTRDWEFQEEQFSKAYRVILFDVRGHGQTDKPDGPYSISLFAADTAALIEKLDAGPAHVVGLSLGGMIALQLVVDYPQLVRSLVIVNSYAEFVPRTFKERLRVTQRFVIARLLGMRKMGQVLSKRLFIKPEQEPLRRLFVERWSENDQQAYLESMKAIVGWSVTAQLGEIYCPTLFIAADEDYTPVSDKKAVVAQIPGAQLVVIKDSRHATPVEHPQQFNAALETFLSS